MPAGTSGLSPWGRGPRQSRCRGRGGARLGAAPQGSSLGRVLQQQVHGLCQVVHVPVSLHFRMLLVTGSGEQGHRLDCP